MQDRMLRDGRLLLDEQTAPGECLATDAVNLLQLLRRNRTWSPSRIKCYLRFARSGIKVPLRSGLRVKFRRESAR